MSLPSSCKYVFGLVMLIISHALFSQQPSIVNFSPKSGTVNSEVIILGSGFSANAADLIVHFGAVDATITQANVDLLSVTVPPGATFRNISVTNLNSGLSDYSSSPFLLSFSGNNFDVNAVSAPINFVSENELYDLSLNDFDSDGKVDIITANNNSNLITVYRNTSTVGTIGFTREFITINSSTLNVNSGDLNGDGKPDVVISKSGNPGDRIYILKNTSVVGNINFDTPDFLLVDGNIARKIEIEDLDRDGLPDIIVTNQDNARISIFRNSSTPAAISFDPIQTVEIIDASVAGLNSSGLAVEDLNGDGFPEITTTQFLEKNVYILPNQSQVGNIQFGATQILNIPGNIIYLIIGDINLDDKPDIVISKLQQNSIAILLNNGTGNSISFSNETLIPVNNRPWGLDLGDLSGDGKVDIAVASIYTTDKKITILENQSSGGTLNLTTKYVTTPEITRNLKLGDIDNDGKPDIALTSIETFNITILRNENCYKPSIIPAGPLSICATETITLETGKGIGINYQWNKDASSVKNGPEEFLDITTPGVYNVIATSESGSCIVNSNAVIVTLGTGSAPALPNIFNSGPFCAGGNITLTTDPIINATYAWTGPNDFTSSNQNITIPNVTADNAGTYSLQVTVGDCSSGIAESVVQVITLPVFSIINTGSTDICEGGSVQLSVSNIAGYTYQWYKDNIPVSGATSSIFDASEEGTYRVEVTQTSTSCTSFSNNTINVNVLSVPTVIFSSPVSGCNTIEVQFLNTSIWDPDGVPTFTWDFGDGSPAATSQDAAHTYTAIGNYNVTLTIGYTSASCLASDIKTINIIDEPVFEIVRSILDTEQLCEGETVDLATLPEFESYIWSTGETTPTISITRSGSYSVTVTDLNGCSGTQTEIVDFLPLPDVIATSEQNEVEPGFDFQLEAQGALTYVWSPADLLDDPTSPTPTASILRSTEFIVVGEDANGCPGSDSVFVSVIGENIIFVTPRKVFSPNGDGIDDFWIIENIERYTDSSIMIFTGNGSTIYEASPYNNDWDAVYNGKNLPEGAYFFVIQVKNKDPKTGSVTVIR